MNKLPRKSNTADRMNAPEEQLEVKFPKEEALKAHHILQMVKCLRRIGRYGYICYSS